MLENEERKKKRKLYDLEKKKQTMNPDAEIRQFCWPRKGCILKVKHKTLAKGKYHKMKGNTHVVDKMKGNTHHACFSI